MYALYVLHIMYIATLFIALLLLSTYPYLTLPSRHPNTLEQAPLPSDTGHGLVINSLGLDE